MTDPVAIHEATEDPTSLALRCSCGNWAMLYRNSFGMDAAEAHAGHAAFMTSRQPRQDSSAHGTFHSRTRESAKENPSA